MEWAECIAGNRISAPTALGRRLWAQTVIPGNDCRAFACLPPIRGAILQEAIGVVVILNTPR